MTPPLVRRSGPLVIAWVVLLALCAGLHAWNARVEGNRLTARDMSRVIGRMISEPERERVEVRAISLVAPGGGRTVDYALEDEIWRCLSQHRVVCRTDAVDGLVRALLEAEGVVRTDDEGRLGEFGLSPQSRLRVVLRGPGHATDRDGDVRFEVDLGHEFPDRSGCFVRRQGNPGVWAIDTNPWSSLTLSASPDGVPLVDPAVVPRAWLSSAKRIDRIDVEKPGGGHSMLLRERELSPDELRRGVSPYRWVLRIGDGPELETDATLASSFNAFTLRAPFARVVAEAPPEAPTEVRGRVVFRGEGEPAALVLGGDDGRGGVLAWFEPLGPLFSVAPAVAELLLPDPPAVLPGTAENPWAPFLRGP